jgi:Ulp1 family protease
MRFEENLELWRSEVVKSAPSQNNGYDCGMCLTLNMEALSRVPRVEEISY